jgi:hypothetical protein
LGGLQAQTNPACSATKKKMNEGDIMGIEPSLRADMPFDVDLRDLAERALRLPSARDALALHET